MPSPGDPQALNRYSYSANNPLRYNDPSGHDWVDAVNFLLGFGAQWASINAWMLPQAQEALSVQPNEPLPMTVGRHLGNVAAIMQGAAEVGAGAGVDASGGGLCLTGVGCLAGAPLVVAGTAVAAHGVTVAGAGAVVEGQMLGNLLLAAANGDADSLPTVFRGGSSLVPRLRDVKIDPKTGLVQSTKGVSLFSDPAKVERFGGAFRVESIPEGLKIVQRGLDPAHYEIVPVESMAWERYVELLQQVKLILVNGQ